MSNFWQRLYGILYDLLENDRTFIFIVYNSFSFGIIFISVVLGIYDTFHDFHPNIYNLTLFIEYLASFIIGFELVGRFILADNKLKYLYSPLTILDFIALIPYMHAFRFIRFIILVSRLLRLTYRYKFFFGFLSQIFKDISYELFFIFSLFFVFFSSILIIIFSVEYTAGNKSIEDFFDAIYYTVITATTVGYGDIVPLTHIGRLLAMALGVLGIFLFSLLTATISTGFFHYVNMLKTGMLSFREMRNHIVICGWNETGEVILEELRKHFKEKKQRMRPIVVVSEQEVQIEGTYYKRGDFVREGILKNAGVEHAETVIILAEKLPHLTEDNIDARSILAAMLVRDLNPRVNLIIEILLRENAKTIKRKKVADYIIVDGEIVGSIISNYIKHKESTELVQFFLEKAEFEEMEVQEVKTFRELIHELGRDYILIGVKRGEEFIMFPDLDFEVRPEDTLLLLKRKEGVITSSPS